MSKFCGQAEAISEYGTTLRLGGGRELESGADFK